MSAVKFGNNISDDWVAAFMAKKGTEKGTIS
jgi:hypothetical protein